MELPLKNNQEKITITGISIKNHPILLFIFGPQLLELCLPYGTITFNNIGTIRIARPIHAITIISNEFCEIIVKQIYVVSSKYMYHVM